MSNVGYLDVHRKYIRPSIFTWTAKETKQNSRGKNSLGKKFTTWLALIGWKKSLN